MKPLFNIDLKRIPFLNDKYAAEREKNFELFLKILLKEFPTNPLLPKTKIFITSYYPIWVAVKKVILKISLK